MYTNDEVGLAAQVFAEVFATSAAEVDIAPTLTCAEVDAIARLMVVTDKADLAAKWIAAHSPTDKDPETEVHYEVSAADYVTEALSF